MGPDLVSIKALCILDNDGARVFSKYYDDHFPTQKEKQEFEKSLFKKTNQTEFEIIVIDGLTVVYRSSVDLLFYIIGPNDENELLLMNTLTTFYETVSAILKKNVEKKALFEKIDSIILAADELIEGGVIMEVDPGNILNRVVIKQEEIPFSEQSVTQVLQTAKEGLKWSLLR